MCDTNNPYVALNTVWRGARWHFNDSYVFFMVIYSRFTFQSMENIMWVQCSMYNGFLATLDMKYLGANSTGANWGLYVVSLECILLSNMFPCIAFLVTCIIEHREATDCNEQLILKYFYVAELE